MMRSPPSGFLLDDVKQHIIDGYVGDPVHAAAEQGGDSYESSRRSTEIQALYAVARAESTHPTPHGELPPTIVAGPDGHARFDSQSFKDWPTDATGVPKPPGQLTPEEVNEIIKNHQDKGGVDGGVCGTARNSWDSSQGPHAAQG